MKLEAHLRWVYISVLMVIDRPDDTLRVGACFLHCRAEVMGESGDTTLPRDEVADECDLTAEKCRFHIKKLRLNRLFANCSLQRKRPKSLT